MIKYVCLFNPSCMLQLNNICKNFKDSSRNIEVLKDVNISIHTAETVAIVGPSGSGKSTLLSIMAGLDTPSSGEVIIDDEHLEQRSEIELSDIRNTKIGFVFQNFELIESYTALENVSLPLEIRGENATKKAKKLLKDVGLSDRMNHYPNELSGGEKQRVAIARALIHDPKILFADEPTGNLDAETSETVLNVLFTQVKKSQTTLVVITHDMDIAKRMQTAYRLENKKLKQVKI
ncbi:ABC transporter [Candidatus Peregrinibacteria bacterium]|nr:MAG: ABC transporter [Candidatus Peregrinibacteria bacterium]